MQVSSLQDPFCVLTRQFDSPDPNRLVSKPTLFFRLQVEHSFLVGFVDVTRCLRVDRRRHPCEAGKAECVLEEVRECILKKSQELAEVKTMNEEGAHDIHRCLCKEGTKGSREWRKFSQSLLLALSPCNHSRIALSRLRRSPEPKNVTTFMSNQYCVVNERC